MKPQKRTFLTAVEFFLRTFIKELNIFLNFLRGTSFETICVNR